MLKGHHFPPIYMCGVCIYMLEIPTLPIKFPYINLYQQRPKSPKMTTQPQKKLHFVIIPFASQGHLIPMIDIARLLAQRNAIVTIFTTPLNAVQFKSIINRDIESGLAIQILELQFPYAESGLPKGCESLNTIPSPSYRENLMYALSLLQQPIEQHFQELKPTPTCIISDKNLVWTPEIAQKFRVPRILFNGYGCFADLCAHNIHLSKIHDNVETDSEPFVVPGLPDRIELTRAQLSSAFNPGSDPYLKELRVKIREAEEGAFGVLVNSFEELEGEYVKEETKTARGGKVWCVGPVSLRNKDDLDKAERGTNKKITSNNKEKDRVVKWLDNWAQGSVVFACLGSMNRVIPPQLAELSLGLDSSKRPFIWVIRGAYKGEEFEKWLKHDGFEERIGKRGLLIRGWAPQVLILSHPAIGAFLTHCGWNSTLEGVCAGVPMVTWPLFGEQFYNEKFILQVSKIGVRVGAERVVPPGKEEKFGVLVKRDQVREAIDKVMDEGKEGEERRLRAKKLAKAAKEAVEEGGSSYLNITSLLEDIMQYGHA